MALQQRVLVTVVTCAVRDMRCVSAVSCLQQPRGIGGTPSEAGGKLLCRLGYDTAYKLMLQWDNADDALTNQLIRHVLAGRVFISPLVGGPILTGLDFFGGRGLLTHKACLQWYRAACSSLYMPATTTSRSILGCTAI